MAAQAEDLLQQFQRVHGQLHAVQQQLFHCPSILHVFSLFPDNTSFKISFQHDNMKNYAMEKIGHQQKDDPFKKNS